MYIDLVIYWWWKHLLGIVTDSYGFPDYTYTALMEDVKANDWFWYTDGNGSCDCNRSMITGLNDLYPKKCDNGRNWPCGDEIEFTCIKPKLDTIREKR